MRELMSNRYTVTTGSQEVLPTVGGERGEGGGSLYLTTTLSPRVHRKCYRQYEGRRERGEGRGERELISNLYTVTTG